MVSRILISIALLCSSVAFSQEESALKFNQVLLIELTEESVVVPEGKVWKITSAIYELTGSTDIVHFKINSIDVDIYRYFSQVTTAHSNNLPIWVPQGSIIESGFKVDALSIIEFNTD